MFINVMASISLCRISSTFPIRKKNSIEFDKFSGQSKISPNIHGETATVKQPVEREERKRIAVLLVLMMSTQSRTYISQGKNLVCSCYV